MSARRQVYPLLLRPRSFHLFRQAFRCRFVLEDCLGGAIKPSPKLLKVQLAVVVHNELHQLGLKAPLTLL
eukprot:COSAG06_NODE_343_length_17092_cov_17.908021_3_plen_70_part_00